MSDAPLILVSGVSLTPDAVGGHRTVSAGFDPSIAAFDDGSYVVVFENSDSSSLGIFARRYDADGNPAGSALQVNSSENANQTDPEVTALGRLEELMVFLPCGRVSLFPAVV